jgi:hypothetical protein
MKLEASLPLLGRPPRRRTGDEDLARLKRPPAAHVDTTGLALLLWLFKVLNTLY